MQIRTLPRGHTLRTIDALRGRYLHGGCICTASHKTERIRMEIMQNAQMSGENPTMLLDKTYKCKLL